LEIIVTAVLLGVLLVISLQLMAATLAHRKTVAQEELAIEEAANAMEVLSVIDWSELDGTSGTQITVSDDAGPILGNAHIDVEIGRPRGTPPSKRVAVRVVWTPRPGEPERSVRLVAWRYPLRGEEGQR
jgi:hypothetical protein